MLYHPRGAMRPLTNLHSGASPQWRCFIKYILHVHRPLGWYCSHCAAQYVTRTSERKHNKTSQMRGCPRLYMYNFDFSCIEGSSISSDPEHWNERGLCSRLIAYYYGYQVRYFPYEDMTKCVKMPPFQTLVTSETFLEHVIDRYGKGGTEDTMCRIWIRLQYFGNIFLSILSWTFLHT